VAKLVVGRQAATRMSIGSDPGPFQDHFPGYPLVPGVLIVESLAQLGGALVRQTLLKAGRVTLPVMSGIDRARFRAPVRPGVQMDMVVDLLSIGDEAARVTGTARVDGQMAATVQILFFLMPEPSGYTPPDLTIAVVES
jgi:3-hydroxyacyl-[acyl-carrier-protein] dehydratase